MTPEGWKDLSLADIANVVSGVGFPRAHQGTQTGEFPFFKVSDMNAPGNDRELRVAANTVDETLLDSLKGTLHPLGTVVFPKVGAALLTNKRRKLVVPSCFDNNVMGLVATGCDPDFLFLLMQTVDFAKHVQPGAVPSVNGSMVGSIRALVPPVPEQRKIAAILYSVDDAIEKTQAVTNQVQIVKRGLMQELLTRGLPGRHTRFKLTEIGKVPAGWGALPLGTLCNVVRGSTPRPARDPRFFDGNHVPWITVGEVTRDDCPFLEKTRTGLTREGARFSRYLDPGTVILTNSGATLGVPKLLKIGGCANDGIAAFLDVSTSLRPLFLYYALAAMTRTFQSRVARGVGQPNLNTSLIGRTVLPVPNRSEQGEIADVLFGCDRRVAVEFEFMQELTALKRGLMSVLLTGQLRVPPDVTSHVP